MLIIIRITFIRLLSGSRSGKATLVPQKSGFSQVKFGSAAAATVLKEL
jgi:hypothetical protein